MTLDQNALEAAARALCREKGINPDALHFGTSDQDISDHTDVSGKKFYYGWRNQVKYASAVLSALPAPEIEAKPVAWRGRWGEVWKYQTDEPAQKFQPFDEVQPVFSADTVAQLERERDEAKSIISRCCAVLPNGALCAPTASMEFMRKVPDEIALVTADLISRAEAAEADNARLRAERDRYREALKPFAAIYDESMKDFPDGSKKQGRPDDKGAWGFNSVDLTWGDFRRARTAMEDHHGE